ncbi:hypothetical protein [Spirulina subsalsa]|uniref:hypothetical protein n=1 Tax=Spirulina subsalsa TaxID=54311 RepID=UPI0002F91F12|nr:hypothetical protein [Spirulina subsalsa]
MFPQKTWVVLAATSLALTIPSLAQAAHLYSATPLPGVIPNLAWVQRSNGSYLMNGFALNNAGQASYQILTPYGFQRNDRFETWSYLWNQNLGSDLLRYGQVMPINAETWAAFFQPEPYTNFLLGQLDQLNETQRLAAYNYLIGNPSIPGLLTPEYLFLTEISYLWEPEQGSYLLGQGQVTGISESGWATFNNDLGGSFAHNLNTRENFAIPTGSLNNPSYFTAINQAQQVTVVQGNQQTILDLSSLMSISPATSDLSQNDFDPLSHWYQKYSSWAFSGAEIPACALSENHPCAYDANLSGQVVGGNWGDRAFLWEDEQFYDLNDLVVGGQGTLVAATAINDRGQILAIASYGTNNPFATGTPGQIYLLTPLSNTETSPPPSTIPEPHNLWGLLAFSLLSVNYCTHKGRKFPNG